jgi:hypothetical protein
LVEVVQAVVAELGGDDRATIAATASQAQQPGDGGLVGALDQVGKRPQVAGEPRPWAAHGKRLGPRPAADPAGQLPDLALQ